MDITHDDRTPENRWAGWTAPVPRIRALRCADGTDEVHRNALARHELRRHVEGTGTR